MAHENVDFATLTQQQLTAIQNFEKEFNKKHDSSLYIMAMDTK